MQKITTCSLLFLCLFGLFFGLGISIYLDRKLLGLKGVTGSFSVTSLQVLDDNDQIDEKDVDNNDNYDDAIDQKGVDVFKMIMVMMGLKMILWAYKVCCSHVHSRSQNLAQEEEQVVRPGRLATAEQEIERFERKFILPLQSSLVAPCSYILYHRRHFSRMTAGTGLRAVLTRAIQAL